MFFETADGGDMDALLGMLVPDVVVHADGGGKAHPIGAPLYGRERVSVIELDVADGAVQAIHAVVNPDKLSHIGPVPDVARLPEKELRQHRHNR
jgi:hypothetical protein